jgi:2-dehydropantoate 2-reductase
VRYVVLGAGAVGATVGGRLAEAGHEVVLVARGEHARVLRARGLRLATPDGVVSVRPPVLDDPARLDPHPGDVLLLCTKTQDSAALLDAVAGGTVGDHPVAEALPVVCVQNGVENERVAARRFRLVYGACVMLPASHLRPGEVDAQGSPYSGALEIGRYPSGLDALTGRICADLTAGRVLATPRADVMAWKYAKLLRNLGNAVEALCAAGPRGNAAGPAVELDRRAREEALACFAAAGIALVGDAEWAAHRGDRVRILPVGDRARSGGSSWQSLARGAGSIETDYLNGEIVLLGRRYGIATPVNRTLQLWANAVARRGGAPGSVAPDDLLAAADRAG